MTRPLDGTVALVTGASSGIGEAVARDLAEHGAAVALVARRADLLDAVAHDIAARSGGALPIVADITDPAQAADAVARTATTLGRLDILVNNAGVMLVGPVADAPPDEWDRMIDLNLRGMLHVTRAALPQLRDAARTGARRVADLVNISSTAGRVARPGNAVYALTKFGVTAFTESLRQELLADRVRVAVVEPGTVDTELVTHVRDDLRDAVTRQVGAIEALRPQDIADAVTYIVTRDRRVCVNELLVRAAEQTW